MILTKETELGTISVSNSIFADIISEAISEIIADHMIWMSTDKGKVIERGSWFSDSDVSKVIDIDYLDDTHIAIEFDIIIKFGVSIRTVTGKLADTIRDIVREQLALETNTITINIAGVRSKKIARRNTKVVFNYETD